MPPRTSLRAFLATARAALSAPPSTRASPLTFVVGNESADLDSLCSALLLAYFHTYAPPKTWGPGLGTLHIPVCHLLRPDLALRPEFTAVLRDADVRSEDVLTLEDILPRRRENAGLRAEDTRWLLVDHNAMTGDLAAAFASRVVGCVDHHADEGVIPADAPLRVIEKAGSCASLVVDRCAEIWAALGAEEDAGVVDAQLARLVLASVLVDTAGLRDGSKTTPLDERAVALAEARVAGFDRAAVFGRLLALKEDLGDMVLRDVLRKDFKEWRVGGRGLGLGTSSVPRGFGYLVAEKGLDGAALDRWGAERDEAGVVDLVAVLTAFRDDGGEFRRELLVWGRSAVGVRAARRFEEGNGGVLGLGSWGDGLLDLTVDGTQWRRCWTQGAVGYSRKQIAPMLRDTLQEVGG
ncbi:exopolyphosphatase-like protein [Xylaria intraflava]|nr:exopolyphosphatase-like protein [Xylaria intraflava]